MWSVFMCLLSISISSLVHLLIRLFSYWILKSSLYILDNRPLLNISFANIFLPVCGLSSHFLDIVFPSYFWNSNLAFTLLIINPKSFFFKWHLNLWAIWTQISAPCKHVAESNLQNWNICLNCFYRKPYFLTFCVILTLLTWEEGKRVSWTHSSYLGLLISTFTSQLCWVLTDLLLSKFILGPDIYPASFTLMFIKHGRLPWQQLTAPDIQE